MLKITGNFEMKRILSFIAVMLQLFAGYQVHAQFINAVGATAGITYANQRFDESAPKATLKTGYTVGYNGAIFADLVHDRFVHWHIEVQFNQKGGAEANNLPNYADHLTYLSVNNYFKVQTELLNIIPYLFAGPNVDYLYQQSTSNSPTAAGYQKFHVGAAAGAGVEFVSYSSLKFFIEGLYNPDVLAAASVKDDQMTNHDFQLRIGLKVSLASNKRMKDMDCNAPVYVPQY